MKGYDKQMEERIRETMQSIDSLPKLKASPLFRVRVMERIETVERKQLRSGSIHAGFNVRLALGALLLAVNIGSAALFFASSEQLGGTADAGDALEQLSEDYTGPELAYYAETIDASGNGPGTGKQSEETGQE